MDFLNEKILGFILIFTRIGAFFAVSPMFNWPAIPESIKVAIALILSIFMAGISSYTPPVAQPDILQIITWTGMEAVYGICLGLIALTLFSVVRSASIICEEQMGLNMASIMDPLTDEQENVLSILIEIFFVLLLLAVNGHHIFLKILFGSFGNYPVGTIPNIVKLVESIILSGSAMLMLALQMSAPILAAFLLIVVILAIMAKVAPEANILFLSFPMRIGLGLFIMGVFVAYINEYIKQFTIWLDKLLVI